MTVHDLHDALNLLPSDLITAADRVRTAPAPRVIHWQRWVSLAAVLALVVGTTLVFQRNIGFDGLKGAGSAPETVMQQAPAAAAPMAPVPAEDEVAAEEAKPEAPAQDSASGTVTENGIGIDHSHRYAEKEETDEDVPSGFCGNLTVTITMAGESHSMTGADALTLTEILRELPYDLNAVCRCMAEFTVDTEMISGIQVNLTQGFARCDKGQAALTEEHVMLIQNIIDTLQ